MDSSSPTFSCDSCGRRYPWKPEYAGRRVRCKCGQAIMAPTSPAEPQDELYDLAPDPAPPVPHGVAGVSPAMAIPAAVGNPAAKPRPVTTTPAAPVPRPAPTLAYETPATAAAVDRVRSALVDPVKDIQVPLALLIGGIVIQFVIGWLQMPSTAGAVFMLVGISVHMVVSTVLMLIAVFIAARFMGLSFGPFWIAILKLCAIAVATPAFAEFLGIFLQYIPGLGGLLTWVATFVFYFALLGMLFDLDQSETIWLVVVIFLVRLFAAIVLIGFLLGM